MLRFLFGFLLTVGGWCHGKRVYFPTAETNSSGLVSFERLDYNPGAFVGDSGVTVSQSSAIPALKTKADSGMQSMAIETSPEASSVSFPSRPNAFSPLPYHRDAIETLSSDSYPMGVVNPESFLPFHDRSRHILQGVVPQKMCDCMPVQLCVNQSAMNFVTTRVITRPPGDTICLPGHVYCCVESTKLGCGIPNVIPGVQPKEGQAKLGQHPWSAIILTNENAFVGGGVLIDENHVLTVAHRMVQYRASDVKVRLGDWDLMHDSEPVRHLEVKIRKIDSHPRFDKNAFKHDVSVITLEKPVSTLTKPYPQINTICTPAERMTFTGQRCKVAGWGKDHFNGNYQSIIKEVEVPVLSAADCQSKLRNTKLGQSFVLDSESFICAGGETGKDACTGDGGNALACMKNGKFYLAGLTAAGLGCGNSNTPGLYVNLVSYMPWIEAVVAGKREMEINPRGGSNL